MSEPNKNIIESTSAAEPVGPYPHARRVGNLLFLSGIGPRERGSKVIPGVTLDAGGKVVDHDIVVQTRSVMRNIKAVLDAAGVPWEDIVDVSVFLTNMERDFAAFNKVYAEYFTGDNRPTRTTVEVGALPTPIAVELKVIAYLGD
ncbi:MAG: RidA family protein [Phycisphaeraceae bacterium]|nr:RidA family protein [Phycisphaeraceae bacterium]